MGPSLFFFSDGDEIADLGDLAAGLRVIRLHGLVADLVQAEGVGGGNVLDIAAAEALDELDLQICHVSAPSLTQNLFGGLASVSSDLLGVAQRLQTFHRRSDDVCRVVRTQALGTDVP